MSARQLRLFPHHKPLLERFGPDFFRALPAGPGVYTMRGEAGRILYIGQSKNLRHRLATYKNAHPEDTPRKIIRMIHQVVAIEWEDCPTPEAAVARETALLRRHRPKFNVQNTWPITWFYLGMRASAEALQLRLTSLAQPHPREDLYGAFQGRMLGRRSFRALIRLLWSALHHPVSPYDFPLRLSHRPAEWEFRWPSGLSSNLVEALPGQVGRFLHGETMELVDCLEAWLLPSGQDPENPPPLRTIFQADIDRLREFFPRGPAALFEFKRHQPTALSYSRPEDLEAGERDGQGCFLWDRPRRMEGQTEFFWSGVD